MLSFSDSEFFLEMLGSRDVQPNLIAPDAVLKRLVISKMVLINFKSYAGKIEIGPFHKVQFKTWLTIVLFISCWPKR